MKLYLFIHYTLDIMNKCLGWSSNHTTYTIQDRLLDTCHPHKTLTHSLVAIVDQNWFSNETEN